MSGFLTGVNRTDNEHPAYQRRSTHNNNPCRPRECGVPGMNKNDKQQVVHVHMTINICFAAHGRREGADCAYKKLG